MSLFAFDTLKYASRLEKSGFQRQQAAELAEVQAEVLNDLMDDKLSTKEDLQKLEIELKQEIQAVDTNLRSEIHKLALQMKDNQNSLLRWMVGLISGTVAILSFIMSAFKFIH